ncbi:MAG: alpha/beta hydrolase [Lachnospiraceae bacterium]|nr:alpha/beta hydrolase [Lachnospiraceae bacterium]
MRYFTFGQGDRPLVILPGLSVKSVMDSAAAVSRRYRVFSEAFTVYVFDRRESLPPVYTIRDMARDTAEAIRCLGLTDVCLFGASQGGMIALEMAVSYPERISKLALGSSAARVGRPQLSVLETWMDLAKAGDAVPLYDAFGARLFPQRLYESFRGAFLASAADVTAEDLARFLVLSEGSRDFDLTDRLSGIRCPVLALGSWDDAVLGAAATLEYAGALGTKKDFSLYMYRGYGHAAYDTAPDYPERLFRFFR